MRKQQTRNINVWEDVDYLSCYLVIKTILIGLNKRSTCTCRFNGDVGLPYRRGTSVCTGKNSSSNFDISICDGDKRIRGGLLSTRRHCGLINQLCYCQIIIHGRFHKHGLKNLSVVPLNYVFHQTGYFSHIFVYQRN